MKKIYPLFIFLVFIYGCVYYNTLFNAKKEFEQAENKRKSSGVRTARVNYNNVIKKCAYIVKEYKNSKYADDALFLLSKALFYKGTNYTQSIENFKQLIEFYPKSEFVPESKIYIARAEYKLNKKDEAITDLKELLDSNIKEKYKAKVLLLLAGYYADEKDYDKAINYLTRLIDKYGKSEEYSQALIKLGNLYYEQKKYDESLKIFNKIVKQRHFEKKVKLDAQYYIALNYFELKKTDMALKKVSKLMIKETRNEQIPKIRILKARILTQKKQYDKAIALFEAVFKDNRRTKYSAEAAYRIAEIYFDYLKDYQKAIQYYNKVKTEKRDSEFKEDALIKSSIASQIIQYYKPQKNIDPLKLINQQMKLAEYYFDFLNKPDSTLKIYDNIFRFKDSLSVRYNNLTKKITGIAKVDSTDSLNYQNYKIKIKNLTDKKEYYNKIMKTYKTEIIPKIYFNKIWLFKNIYKDTLKAKEIFNELKEKYPQNKYRFAAEELLKNKKVVFHTPQEILDWKKYNNAIAVMDSMPKTALSELEQLKNTTDEKLKEKVKFALGYISYFSLQDTLSAKPYFKDLYETDTYGPFIRKFYDGNRFTVLDSLNIPNSLLNDEDKSKKKKK